MGVDSFEPQHLSNKPNIKSLLLVYTADEYSVDFLRNSTSIWKFTHSSIIDYNSHDQRIVKWL